MNLSFLFMAMGGLILTAPAISAPARASAPAADPVQIELSQQLDEERAERLESLVERFNSQQKNVHLKTVRRIDGDAPKQINPDTGEITAIVFIRGSRPFHNRQGEVQATP